MWKTVFAKRNVKVFLMHTNDPPLCGWNMLFSFKIGRLKKIRVLQLSAKWLASNCAQYCVYFGEHKQIMRFSICVFWLKNWVARRNMLAACGHLRKFKRAQWHHVVDMFFQSLAYR